MRIHVPNLVLEEYWNPVLIRLFRVYLYTCRSPISTGHLESLKLTVLGSWKWTQSRLSSLSLVCQRTTPHGWASENLVCCVSCAMSQAFFTRCSRMRRPGSRLYVLAVHDVHSINYVSLTHPLRIYPPQHFKTKYSLHEVKYMDEVIITMTCNHWHRFDFFFVCVFRLRLFCKQRNLLCFSL